MAGEVCSTKKAFHRAELDQVKDAGNNLSTNEYDDIKRETRVIG
jgi:hypothetical protein